MRLRRSFTAFAAVVACGGSSDPAPRDAAPGPDASPADVGRAASADVAPFVCAITAPTACPTPAPTYAAVEPLFESRCVTTCHGGVPGGPWPLRGYQHVADWADIIRGAMLTCEMPPRDSGVTMTADERVAILTWIVCGFPR